MTAVLIGILGFGLFFIYDWNSVRQKHTLLHHTFAVGCLMVVCASVRLSLDGVVAFTLPAVARGGALLMMLLMLGLLIYTLFFALPFQETYVDTAAGPGQAYTEGVYALCRHPGVLWFAGVFLFYWLFSGKMLVLWGGLAFSACNVVYIMFQDRWTFVKNFTNYDEYRQMTPFLIPNGKSIKKCVRTLVFKRG